MARNQTKEAINGSKKAINELFTKVDEYELIALCVARVWFLSWCAAAAPLSDQSHQSQSSKLGADGPGTRSVSERCE